jgi:hypothetical protein
MVDFVKHVVMYSGGMGSWATAKRVIAQHGVDNTLLVFTDTKGKDDQNEHAGEDPDTYRFIDETVQEMGVELVRLEDGRNVWEVYKAVRFIGNSSLAPCSHHLKQKVAMKWIRNTFQPDECVVYIGIDWTEAHRTAAPTRNYAPYEVKYPMCEEPYITKWDMIRWCNSLGIREPRSYALGFPHNNCGGFCCRAGHAQFKILLEKNPERYAYHEQKEQEMREYLGKDVSVLSRKIGKTKHPLTLVQLREELERRNEGTGEQLTLDLDDFGGCGCFVDELWSEETACTVSEYKPTQSTGV